MRRLAYGFAFAVLISGWAGAAQAQVTVTTEPGLPESGTPVTLIVRSVCSCPSHDVTFTRTGFLIEIARSSGCVSACLSDQEVRYNLGLLAPGVYTVRNYRIDIPSNATVIGTFAVHGPAIPTLDAMGMAVLLLSMALIAFIVLRR